MPEFRDKFYKHYVTNFKGVGSTTGYDQQSYYLTWCEFKFGPLLKGLPTDSRILDLGCGSGDMLKYLSLRGFTQALGIDLSEEQVELAVRSGANAENTDAFEFLRNNIDEFDAIIALDFIEHFHKDEILLLASLIFSVLKPGGRLILQTPNGEGLFPGQVIYGDFTHLTIFTSTSLEQLLREVGFQEFLFFETGPVPKNFTGRLRLVLWSGIKLFVNTIRKIEAGKSNALWTENMICFCRKPFHKNEN